MSDVIRLMPRRINKESTPYSYVELLAARGLLRNDTKVVEGCVGNSGWSASLHVAHFLGTAAVYHMVEMDSGQLAQHEARFKFGYDVTAPNRSEKPKLVWQAGRIEEQGILLGRADLLLFHNYVPLDQQTYEVLAGISAKADGSYQRVQGVLEQIISAGPKVIAIFLPEFKKPNTYVEMLRSLGREPEVVPDIDYAGQIEPAKREQFKGKTLIVDLRR